MFQSLVYSSVSPRLFTFRFTPYTHPSFDLPFLRVPSGSHFSILFISLFPGTLFGCTTHCNGRSSFTSNKFLSALVIAVMVSLRTFSFRDFILLLTFQSYYLVYRLKYKKKNIMQPAILQVQIVCEQSAEEVNKHTRRKSYAAIPLTNLCLSTSNTLQLQAASFNCLK